MRTTGVPASAPSTTRATTAPSSWTPTVTTSRSSTTTAEPWPTTPHAISRRRARHAGGGAPRARDDAILEQKRLIAAPATLSLQARATALGTHPRYRNGRRAVVCVCAKLAAAFRQERVCPPSQLRACERLRETTRQSRLAIRPRIQAQS